MPIEHNTSVDLLIKELNMVAAVRERILALPPLSKAIPEP